MQQHLHESLVQRVQNSLEEAPAVQLSAQCPGVALTSLGGLRETLPAPYPAPGIPPPPPALGNKLPQGTGVG